MRLRCSGTSSGGVALSHGKTAYVTGGTGFLGSHLVERLVKENYRVRALVRPASDCSLLDALGVELVRGDITDPPERLRPGMEGATHLFHCAAIIDEWSPLDRMVRVNVEGLRNVLEAARHLRLERFVHMSSAVVYGAHDQVDTDESAPFVETGDHYNHTKIACERLLKDFTRETGLRTVVLRPPYIYGERDRQLLPRVVGALRDQTWVYLSGGTVPFTLACVENVVDVCILAASRQEAVGEGFLITDGETITRREFVDILCDEMGYDRPEKSLSRVVAKLLCPVSEGLAKLLGMKEPPRLNRFRYKFAGVRLTFDISKARRLLGYEPKYRTRDSLRGTARWFSISATRARQQ
jgi:nucleoside-diphosphate-sugar epimerase